MDLRDAPRGVPIHHSLFDPLSHLPHAALNGGTTPLPNAPETASSTERKREKIKEPPKPNHGTPKARSHSRGQGRATALRDEHSTGAPRLDGPEH